MFKIGDVIETRSPSHERYIIMSIPDKSRNYWSAISYNEVYKQFFMTTPIFESLDDEHYKFITHLDLIKQCTGGINGKEN